MFCSTTVLLVEPCASTLSMGGIDTKWAVAVSGSVDETSTSRSPTVSLRLRAEPAISTRLTASQSLM